MIGCVWIGYTCVPFEGVSRSCLQREGIKGCSRQKEQNAHNTQRHTALRNRGVPRAHSTEYLGVTGIA